MDLEHEKRLSVVEERSKTNERRIGDIENRQDNLDKLVSTVEALAVREGHVEADVKEIKQDVKAITEKPGRRWDSLVDKIIWAIAAAFVGYVLAQIGL